MARKASMLSLLGIVTISLGATVLLGPAAAEDEGDRTSTCGYGIVFTGEQRIFNYEIDFTVEVAPGKGYKTDCIKGWDAYLELQEVTADRQYAYRVWGQIGEPWTGGGE
jgi:hypothetical protein